MVVVVVAVIFPAGSTWASPTSGDRVLWPQDDQWIPAISSEHKPLQDQVDVNLAPFRDLVSAASPDGAAALWSFDGARFFFRFNLQGTPPLSDGRLHDGSAWLVYVDASGDAEPDWAVSLHGGSLGVYMRSGPGRVGAPVETRDGRAWMLLKVATGDSAEDEGTSDVYRYLVDGMARIPRHAGDRSETGSETTPGPETAAGAQFVEFYIPIEWFSPPKDGAFDAPAAIEATDELALVYATGTDVDHPDFDVAGTLGTAEGISAEFYDLPSVIPLSSVAKPLLQLSHSVDNSHPRPGGEVKVTSVCTNAGALVARHVAVVEPIPPPTRYVRGSVQVSAGVAVWYRHDASGAWDRSESEPVTAIKWVVSEVPAGGGKVSFSYRVRVK